VWRDSFAFKRFLGNPVPPLKRPRQPKFINRLVAADFIKLALLVFFPALALCLPNTMI